MKTLMKLVVLGLLISSCNDTNFGARAVKTGNASPSEDDPLLANGFKNQGEAPLDISAGPGAGTNTPKPGSGPAAEKVVELGCDKEGGAIVEVSGSPTGLEPLPVTAQRLLGGTDVTIGTDGKPTTGEPQNPGTGTPTTPGPTTPLPTTPPVVLNGDEKITARVKGAFCPTSQKKLTMLFVVDASGSMGRHVSTNTRSELPGYDPQINGSCGRLQAARAILEKVALSRQAGDDISVGMVPFAGGIITNKIINVTPLDTFLSLVSKESFCQHVVQDAKYGYDPINPGGIKGSTLLGPIRVDASTNYQAAFQAAETMLRPVYGRKVIYFLSDGEPTSGGVDPVQAGIAAGKRLRASVDNLTLNALLLGNPGNHAWAVLQEIAGSPDRVRHSTRAEELARDILVFPAAAIDPNTARALLTVSPLPATNLGIRYFGEDATRPGVWLYETQPFILLGTPGQIVENVVQVTAQGTNGSTHSSVVRFRYQR